MILTNCAACAAPLAHDAPRCVRCHTRYCDKTCQHDHWRRGHKQICKRIHRGGNAEQYYADKKYKEAVADYTATLVVLRRFEEAKALLRKTMPVARRVLGKNDETTLRARCIHAMALSTDPNATLDDLREAVSMLEETDRIGRRVFGGTHPLAATIERELQDARAALRARETPSPGRP
jgi:hypothetical protein